MLQFPTFPFFNFSFPTFPFFHFFTFSFSRFSSPHFFIYCNSHQVSLFFNPTCSFQSNLWSFTSSLPFFSKFNYCFDSHLPSISLHSSSHYQTMHPETVYIVPFLPLQLPLTAMSSLERSFLVPISPIPRLTIHLCNLIAFTFCFFTSSFFSPFSQFFFLISYRFCHS